MGNNIWSYGKGHTPNPKKIIKTHHSSSIRIFLRCFQIVSLLFFEMNYLSDLFLFLFYSFSNWLAFLNCNNSYLTSSAFYSYSWSFCFYIFLVRSFWNSVEVKKAFLILLNLIFHNILLSFSIFLHFVDIYKRQCGK